MNQALNEPTMAAPDDAATRPRTAGFWRPSIGFLLGRRADLGSKVELDRGLWRQSIEFLLVLCLTVMVFRTFAAEAYIVPTGSMAPTLLGNHRELTCPNCGFHVVIGMDDGGRGGRAICSNCGQSGFDSLNAVESNGDRVLVQKFLYDVRRPNRWEIAVFHFPGDPTQAYVKRVVGLPNEAIRIRGGNVFVDGRIARKTLKEQRAMRVLVFDNNYLPKDANRFPRWMFRRGRPNRPEASDWRQVDAALVHNDSAPARPTVGPDWVDYRHWEPERGRYAPIHDFSGYNGNDVRADNVVDDLMISARVAPGREVKSVLFRIDSGGDRFVVELPVLDNDATLKPTVTRNRRALTPRNARGGVPRAVNGNGSLVEISVMDHRLTVAVEGALLFEPLDYNDPSGGSGFGTSPLGIGVDRGALTLKDVRIYRDVYYTNHLAFSPRRSFGVDTPFQLGPDEFFVLGDNSPVSNDSRFWPDSPVVPGELLLGKPFLVHLPGQAVPFRVFGSSPYWVPDPREIRYIR